MIIDGEKYACEACVRGHRVSSCMHTDRKLLHVNKKGRPVSQCPHCRSLRKNRAQHVKCECHDKSHAKEDCPHLPHLKELNERSGGSPPKVCCCGHGARCTCSLKKEPHLESVPEDINTILHQKELPKHRGPNHNQHDSKPTIFTNGHHKPVHKFNDAHNHCGAPYRIPSRSHSHHGHREIAQRSTENLPFTANRPAVHHESPLHNVVTASHPTRQARSEHNSPLLPPTSNPNLPPFHVEVPPLNPDAYSYSPFDAQSPNIQPGGSHLPDEIPHDWFMTHDDIRTNGPPNIPELASVNWSNYGYGNHHDIYNLSAVPSMSAYYQAASQIPSYVNSMEHLNQLNDSGFNTSSGDVSEAEDPLTGYFRPSALRTISHASNDVSSNGGDDDILGHRLSSTSSYHGTPVGNALAGDFGNLDIEKLFPELKAKPNQPTSAPQHVHDQSQSQFAFKPALSPSQTTDYQSPQSYQQPSQQYQQAGNFSSQPTPPQLQINLSTPPESIRGYSITSGPSPPDTTSPDQVDINPDTPYTIREAMTYAHMSVQATNEPVKDNSGIPMFKRHVTLEDPMWYELGADGCNDEVDGLGFGLDDEREDEAWAR